MPRQPAHDTVFERHYVKLGDALYYVILRRERPKVMETLRAPHAQNNPASELDRPQLSGSLP